VVIVALLVMPMPSNKVRGMVQGSINKFWHSQEYVKKTSEWQSIAWQWQKNLWLEMMSYQAR
jgi:hypothetical protein